MDCPLSFDVCFLYQVLDFGDNETGRLTRKKDYPWPKLS
jgi:hypothetical protein